jgi:hypothetical protein
LRHHTFAWTRSIGNRNTNATFQRIVISRARRFSSPYTRLKKTPWSAKPIFSCCQLTQRIVRYLFKNQLLLLIIQISKSLWIFQAFPQLISYSLIYRTYHHQIKFRTSLNRICATFNKNNANCLDYHKNLVDIFNIYYKELLKYSKEIYRKFGKKISKISISYFGILVWLIFLKNVRQQWKWNHQEDQSNKMNYVSSVKDSWECIVNIN